MMLLRILSAAVIVMTVGPFLTAQEMGAISRIRESFYRAVDFPEEVEPLKTYIEKVYPGDPLEYPPLIQAYYAAAVGLQGKFSDNPLVKISKVKEGIGYMELAVGRAPENVECRFLRFAFYEQIPRAFGVRDRVPSDLEIMIAILKSGKEIETPIHVRRDMADYAMGTSALSDAQRRAFTEIRGSF